MGKSRLEKFLYALYSLDSSDLPTPLSRIEELYKCWVTGEEAPTFKPLSRVEKYLMAILGVYDVDSLPNPLSRVEVLLYKLATGDDNLDDVEIFLSEHEELLAGVIRNGGAGGNIDIEYVLYTLSTEHNTLYNTAEKPVKSAILKGDTLVNILSESNINIKSTNTYRVNYAHNLNTTKTYILQYRINQIPELSDATDSGRLLKFEWYSGTKDGGYFDVYNKDISVGTNNFIIINPFSDEVTKTYFGVWCPNHVSGNLDMDIILIEYRDGMENWDIPYFEGIQSVKMPVLKTVGKNLWYGDKDVFIANGIENFNMSFKKGTYYFTGYVDTVYPNGPTTIVFINTFTGYEIGAYINHSNSPVTLKEDCNQVKIYTNGWSYVNSTNKPQTIKNLMLSNTYPISYEPYKSNILTVDEEVELRGIGEVKDELNLLTGELTRRIGEIVLDGSENWTGDWTGEPNTSNQNKTISAYVLRLIDTDQTNSTNIICERFQSKNVNMIDEEGIYIHGSKGFRLRISKDKLSSLDINGFKTYLQSNPLTVQYPTTESIKTVDLSVVNQDGNNTELSTFNDITHVTLSSEELIPEAELEVATKNEEVLNTMSLEMDDISTSQNTLEETVNTQSENVYSTMLATTEIYEGLL